ncbi:MAG: hypothetical protein B7Y47_02995 [Sphingomonas sp. 28-63-12]|nr:MAG: hypothetical protein B7Y47_02995 [Sphingomonas sp. 28-63-12]
MTVGVLVFVQQQSAAALVREQRQSVTDLRDELLDAYKLDGRTGLARLIADRLQSPQRSIAVILLATDRGRPIIGNLADWPATVGVKTDWREISLYRRGSDRPDHLGISTSLLPDGSRLLAGHVTDGSMRLAKINQDAIGLALLGGLGLILVSALLLGRLLSTEFDSIAATAKRFASGDLAQRIPIKGAGDSFDALGSAINAMLDRIERLIAELRMVTDGLAHDLKSPVTRLKSVIERALIDTEDPMALAALDRVAGEADSLLAMLTTALLISRAEAGIGREAFAVTDIAALISDIAEIYGPLVEDHGFTITASAASPITARVHKELISRAIGNLVENAINYAAGGSAITISAARGPGGRLVLVVADNGPGIDPASRAEALRRFGRLDPARNIAGSGLGLSLVGATAHLHDGTVDLADNAPGLRVVLTLGVNQG